MDRARSVSRSPPNGSTPHDYAVGARRGGRPAVAPREGSIRRTDIREHATAVLTAAEGVTSGDATFPERGWAGCGKRRRDWETRRRPITPRHPCRGRSPGLPRTSRAACRRHHPAPPDGNRCTPRARNGTRRYALTAQQDVVFDGTEVRGAVIPGPAEYRPPPRAAPPAAGRLFRSPPAPPEAVLASTEHAERTKRDQRHRDPAFRNTSDRSREFCPAADAACALFRYREVSVSVNAELAL